MRFTQCLACKYRFLKAEHFRGDADPSDPGDGDECAAVGSEALGKLSTGVCLGLFASTSLLVEVTRLLPLVEVVAIIS